MRATTADRTQSATHTYLICLAAWAIPGAGHLLQGRLRKGLTFLITLTLMFVFGLWLEGRLFPVTEISQPLVALAALADMGIGIAFFIAHAMGLGAGRVIAQTYEYGNAFLIVAGLMNMLVVLDAFDIAQGRK
jgi:TM2 domain-containing membrane protein YozV